jgi:hypothetical protein
LYIVASREGRDPDEKWRKGVYLFLETKVVESLSAAKAVVGQTESNL